jgi:hypothetical protein
LEDLKNKKKVETLPKVERKRLKRKHAHVKQRFLSINSSSFMIGPNIKKKVEIDSNEKGTYSFSPVFSTGTECGPNYSYDWVE